MKNFLSAYTIMNLVFIILVLSLILLVGCQTSIPNHNFGNPSGNASIPPHTSHHHSSHPVHNSYSSNTSSTDVASMFKITISPCVSNPNMTSFLYVNLSRGVVVRHKLSYVCCANLTVTPIIEGTTLKIYENNIGEFCRCICNYNINITSNIDYIRKVEVYGVKYVDPLTNETIYNYELLGQYPNITGEVYPEKTIENLTIKKLIDDRFRIGSNKVRFNAILRSATDSYFNGVFYLEEGGYKLNVTNWLPVETLPCPAGKKCLTMRDFLNMNATYLGYLKDGRFVVLNATLLSQPKETECSSDEDCLPAKCCHPRICVPKELAPDCTNQLCTLECQGGTLDCGQGRCVCVNGKCSVEWKNKQSLSDLIK